MSAADPNAEFASALAASLAALGLEDVCISPGSRNTPLTAAFAARPDVRDWSHHDERSSGFFAVGLARASGRPVALVSTSGTAAAEYHPAVVEALQSRVPLIVLTADRPPELRDVGAPQAIDQIKLYGDHVKWFHQGAPPDAEVIRHAPGLAFHAWATAIEPPPGPVHLNLPFREPLLVSRSGALRKARSVPHTVGVGAPQPGPHDLEVLADLLARPRCLFVVGALPDAATAAAIDTLASDAGAIVFADPQSRLRFGPTASTVIQTADLLTAEGALDLEPPDAVVRWGPVPTSKPVWRWLEQHLDVPQAVVDWGGHRDPLGSATHLVRSDPAATAAALRGPEGGSTPWSQRWQDLDKLADIELETAIQAETFPNEPAIARLVMAAAPQGSALFAGSSLPIRDVDSFAAARTSSVPVFANRGANGIDGSISTALGIAAAGTQCTALIGDVAALHDIGALASARRLGLPLTVVIVHNDGGGIFNLLPQADPSRMDPAVFERHLGTPHGTDFAAVARAFGLRAERIESAFELAEAVGTGAGPAVYELRTDRADVAPIRSRLRAAVARVLT